MLNIRLQQKSFMNHGRQSQSALTIVRRPLGTASNYRTWSARQAGRPIHEEEDSSEDMDDGEGLKWPLMG